MTYCTSCRTLGPPWLLEQLSVSMKVEQGKRSWRLGIWMTSSLILVQLDSHMRKKPPHWKVLLQWQERRRCLGSEIVSLGWRHPSSRRSGWVSHSFCMPWGKVRWNWPVQWRGRMLATVRAAVANSIRVCRSVHWLALHWGAWSISSSSNLHPQAH